MINNKKADIPIMILVIGVIALCMLALMSFYMAEEKQKSDGIDSVFHLQEVYNSAESVKYSGSADNYIHTEYDGENFVIERGLLDKEQEISFKVVYEFEP